MYTPHSILLELFPERFAVCQLAAAADLPTWVQGSGFCAIVRTMDELSIVCQEQIVPAGVKAETGWRVLGVRGPLDFSLVGVLAGIAQPLANAGVSIFAISTYNTDYILLKETQLEQGLQALAQMGFVVRGYDSLST